MKRKGVCLHMKIAIVTDSNSGITQKKAKEQKGRQKGSWRTAGKAAADAKAAPPERCMEVCAPGQ